MQVHMTVHQELISNGFDYNIFRGKRYYGHIDNITKAAGKIEEVKRKYG